MKYEMIFIVFKGRLVSKRPKLVH